MSDQVSTGIEQIPVELWHEIFEYFDLHGLWYSFRRLNRRINAIIDQTPLHLMLRRRRGFVRYKENILRSMNPANVLSLVLDDGTESLQFFSILPLGSFVQLRTLTLEYMRCFDDPNFTFWKQLSVMKHLYYLRIICCSYLPPKNYVREQQFFIRSIFNHGFCPGLRSFLIHIYENRKKKLSIPSLLPSTKAIELRHFAIDYLAFNDLITLLPGMGNIKSFCVDLRLSEDRELITKPLPDDTSLLPECRHLKLKFNRNLSFRHLEYLLAQTPKLESLFLWGWSQLANLKKWSLIFSKHCLKLTSFKLTCTCEALSNAVDRTEKECRTNSFWLERNVVTTYTEMSDSGKLLELVVQFDIRKNKHCRPLTITGWV